MHQTKPINCLVFDIGKVIWDYSPGFRFLHQSWAKLTGLSVSDFSRRYHQVYQQLETNKKSLSSWIKEVNPSLPFQQIEQSLQKFTQDADFFTKHANQPLIDFIINLQSKHFLVGCLSNTEKYIYPFLKKHILPFFDFSILSWQVGYRKPDPKIYHQIFSHYQGNYSQVLFIDDKSKNTFAAQKLGINAIRYQNYLHFLKEFSSFVPL